MVSSQQAALSNAATQLRAAGEAAHTAAIKRHKLNDRHPAIKETFSYDTAGLVIVLDLYSTGYDIEIRRDGHQIAAVWRDADGLHTTYISSVETILPLIVAAIIAAGSGALIVEVAPAL